MKLLRRRMPTPAVTRRTSRSPAGAPPVPLSSQVHFWVQRRKGLLLGGTLVVIVVLLVQSVIAALRPAGGLVLVAARDLPAHHQLTATDVTWMWLPQAAIPPAAVADAQEVSGALRFPLDQQQVLTRSMFLPAGKLTAPAGHSVVGIPIRSGQAVPPVLAGDHVQLTIAAHASNPSKLAKTRTFTAQVITYTPSEQNQNQTFDSGSEKETSTLWVSTQRNNAATISLYSAQGLVGIALLP